MDEDSALRFGRVAGSVTLVAGVAMLVAPRRLGRLVGIAPALARGIGVVDLALVPGLLAGSPRWPWLAARAGANVGTAAALVGTGRRWPARVAALALTVLTAVDGTAARTLRRNGR